MTTEQLIKSLKDVDWNAAIEEFSSHGTVVNDVDACCNRIAIWAKQFENAEKGNAALAFIRATQSASFHVAAACALGLYRNAAASIRSILENGLYFTYFRLHPSELTTLSRDPSYHVSRLDLISYHKLHTKDFKSNQEKLGFLSGLDSWYSDISQVVHGQIPGTWIEHTSLSSIKHDKQTLAIVVSKFKRSEELLHQLFLLTAGKELWDHFSPSSKKFLIAGMHSDIRAALGIDKS